MHATATTRTEAIDHVATTLLARASRLTRLLMRSGTRELSRTEAGLLLTLLDGPRRITELAETEALAQPTVTQLVDRLEQRGAGRAHALGRGRPRRARIDLARPDRISSRRHARSRGP